MPSSPGCLRSLVLPALLSATGAWAQAQAPLPGSSLRAPAEVADPAAAAGAALRLPLAEHAQMVYQPRPWQQPDTPTASLPASRASLGLEFKAVRPTDGAASVLRVQLAGDSVLQFRPRGGGLSITYRSQF